MKNLVNWLFPPKGQRKAKRIRIRHTVSQTLWANNRQTLMNRMAYDLARKMLEQGAVRIDLMEHFGRTYRHSNDDRFIVTMTVEVLEVDRAYLIN